MDDEKRSEAKQRKVNVVTNHVGCYSEVRVKCGRLHHVTCCKPQKRKVAKKKDKNGQEYVRNTLLSHEVNRKVVISALVMGIDDEAGVVICDMAVQTTAEELEAEIKATVDEKYNDWKILHGNNPEVAGPEPLSFKEWDKFPHNHEKKH
eukprot:6601167-Ditylum_brightwellii.AAC.1